VRDGELERWAARRVLLPDVATRDITLNLVEAAGVEPAVTKDPIAGRITRHSRGIRAAAVCSIPRWRFGLAIPHVGNLSDQSPTWGRRR